MVDANEPLPDWMKIEDLNAPYDVGNWGDDIEDELPGYEFYNAAVKLFFDPKPHVYYKFDEEGNRQDVDGVTTVLDIVNKPFLKAWAAKVAIEYVKDQCIQADGSFTQWATEEFLAMLQEAKAQHTVHLDYAGNIGHKAHGILEDSIRFAIEHTDGIVLELKNLPQEDTDVNRKAINCARVAFEWMQKHNVRWLSTERKIYSLIYNFAGTADGKAMVDSCEDLRCCGGRVFKDRLSIIDFKSSNQLSETYPLQAAAYQFAEIEEFGEYITDRWILRLGKENDDFEPWYLPVDEFEADFETFIAALTLHRSLRDVNERRRVAKTKIRFLIKQQRDKERAEKNEADRLERLRIRAEKMAATAARNAAKDARYKALRAEGKSVLDAKAIVAEEFPKPVKAEEEPDENNYGGILVLEADESPDPEPEEEPFQEEWVLKL